MMAWLDVRSQGGRFVLRLEDIDPTAQSRAVQTGLVDDLTWFGLGWDELVWQSSRRASHEAALDSLAALGVLYECGCSRTTVKAAGLASAAGGWVYPGTCRHRRVTQWRTSGLGLRVDVSGISGLVHDESGADLSQTVETAMGDPLVRRADGGVTYQLAVVVDDAEAGVTRVVRGRDLATNTATQVALARLLGYPVPTYRHHLLLLEPQGQKLAKLHQSIGADVLRQHYRADELRGFLAAVAGLGDGSPVAALADLVPSFSWERVTPVDRVVTWDGRRLGATPSDR
jgi:glutamyl/glutaminyl-tRNA synthetase